MTLVSRTIAVLTLWLGSAVSSCTGAGKTEAKAPAPPPPTVYVAQVERRDLQLTSESVATLDGYVNAEIRARVKGFLKAQLYKDGAFVKRGQPLFTIEEGEYAAAVKGARAGVARARAADARNRVLLERSEGLFQTGMLSQQDLDDARTGLADTQGSVEAAEAELASAALDLSYTKINAPVEGVAGVANVRIGNLVGQDGPTLLTTVSQLDPLRVSFALSEIDFVKYPDRLKRFDERDLAWARRQFAKLDADGVTEDGDAGVELLLSDGRVHGHRGVIVAADRQIDPTSGTIRLQALFPNPDNVLRPGQYGRVRMARGDEGRAQLVVPEQALILVQGSYSLGVVNADNKVELRRIEIGPAVAGLRAVKSGVTEGERVVVEGVQKISDGAPVRPEPLPPAPAAGGKGPLPPAPAQGGPGDRAGKPKG
jgi:membrane fusion protein (multidrug efflux system)